MNLPRTHLTLNQAVLESRGDYPIYNESLSDRESSRIIRIVYVNLPGGCTRIGEIQVNVISVCRIPREVTTIRGSFA